VSDQETIRDISKVLRKLARLEVELQSEPNNAHVASEREKFISLVIKHYRSAGADIRSNCEQSPE
jgi:hypothetical protein